MKKQVEESNKQHQHQHQPITPKTKTSPGAVTRSSTKRATDDGTNHGGGGLRGSRKKRSI
jgi:hypothetical protein